MESVDTEERTILGDSTETKDAETITIGETASAQENTEESAAVQESEKEESAAVQESKAEENVAVQETVKPQETYSSANGYNFKMS